MKGLTDEEKKFIREAAGYLEHPSYAARLAGLIGKPIEKGIELLPAPVRGLVEGASQRAIEGALGVALTTIGPREVEPEFQAAVSGAKTAGAWHSWGTAVTGAVGGALGLPALAVELPLTTTLMFRSIAEIAGLMGESLQSSEARLECLTVFSLGGRTSADDAAESSYYATRLAMAQLTDAAARWVAGKTVHEILKSVQTKSAPPLVTLIARVASRFNIVVGQKALGQMVPLIGAGAGAAINATFTEHFNRVARYHFGLRRLERAHGEGAVRELYRFELAKPV